MAKRAQQQPKESASSTPPLEALKADPDFKKLAPRERHMLAAELQARRGVLPNGQPMNAPTGKTQQQLINEVLKPSTARDFLDAYVQAYEEGIIVVLGTTGLRVRICTVDIATMLVLGEIPDFLSPIAAKTLWIEQSEEVLGNNSDLAKEVMRLIDYVVPLALLEPRVVVDREPDYDANEISLKNIPFADRYAIFSLAIQPTEVLRQFRDQQAQNLEALFTSAGWTLPAEQNPVSVGIQQVSPGMVQMGGVADRSDDDASGESDRSGDSGADTGS